MTASPLHRAGRGDDHDPPPTAVELYRLAVEEYRWQAGFNWSRTRYLLAFNVAVTGLGVVLSSQSVIGAVVVFALGALAAALTVAVVHVQHGYYRASRSRMQRVEADLALPAGWHVDTTATLGGRGRTVSVTQLVYVLLAAVAVADVASIVVAVV